MFAYASRMALAGGLALLSLGHGGGASAAAGAAFMRLNGSANPPIGYVEFCRTYPSECTARGGQEAEALTETRWRELREINSFANRVVTPATDMDHYRREELWALPDSHGDCEDYVLLKRKWLIQRGWPSGSLLVTVVFDEIGEGHAVLLVRTDRGELVLDDKTDEIRAWFATAYRFVKRQSVTNPNRWVSVGDPRWTSGSTAAPR